MLHRPTASPVLHVQSLEAAVAELSTRSAANAAVISQLNTDIVSLSAPLSENTLHRLSCVMRHCCLLFELLMMMRLTVSGVPARRHDQ